jgi:methyl-accepting chemotaxis protein
MGDEQNGHGVSRLDRMEGLMELLIEDHLKFRDEHKSLLTSQVLLTDRVDKLASTVADLSSTVADLSSTVADLASTTADLASTTADLVSTTGKLSQRMDDLAETMKEVAEAQKHADQRMDALIAVVDGMIRRPPGDSPAH